MGGRHIPVATSRYLTSNSTLTSTIASRTICQTPRTGRFQCAYQSQRPNICNRPASIRRFSSTQATSNTFTNATSTSEPRLQFQAQSQSQLQTLQIPARWLSDIKSRLGKCIMFGMSTAQVARAASILRVVAKDWRELSAGSEGFLTQRGRAGLLRHRVVWGEMDSMSHVNNVTYTRYAESARVEWARNYATYIDPTHKKEWSDLWTPKGDGMILRSIRTDYKFPMTWPDRVSVFHKLRSLPTSSTDSFILDVMIMSERHQRVAARCEEDIVMYDYKVGKKIELRPFMAKAFRETFELQEEARLRNCEKIQELLKDVRTLEVDTWDREGAVEDMGGK